MLGIAFLLAALGSAAAYPATADIKPRLPLASFFRPNEQYPQDAREILNRAPQGTYVSVGTERGFIGAALSPNVDRLWLIDRDPKVVRFNRINTALLQASSNRRDYVFLRLQATWEDWKKRLAQLEPSSARLLGDPKNWSWWDKQVRQEQREWGNPNGTFDTLHYPGLFRKSGEFRGANYLHRNDLFKRLSKLAKAGGIQIKPLDFTDAVAVDQWLERLGPSPPKISVLDLSNAWDQDYIGPQATEKLIEKLRPMATPESVFLITAHRIFKAFPALPPGLLWDYFGFTFGYLESQGGFSKIVPASGFSSGEQTLSPGHLVGEGILMKALSDSRDRIYPSPDEYSPRETALIRTQSPAGAYVSVGTGRGFIGASMSPSINALVLISQDPFEARFIRINIALLKVSESYEDYLRLGLAASAEDWGSAVSRKCSQEHHLDTIAGRLLSDPKTWEWWDKEIRSRWANHIDHDPYEDEQFIHIQEMAKKDRIWVKFVSLRDHAQLQQLAQTLRRRNIPLSLLDLSGIRQQPFMPAVEAGRIVRDFKSIALPQTILLKAQGPGNCANLLARSFWGYPSRAFPKIQSR